MATAEPEMTSEWHERLAWYNRVRDTYREQRGGTLLPLQYVGSYADLLAVGESADEAGCRHAAYTLDLRNFDDVELNRVVEQFHDRWLTWTTLLRRATSSSAPAHQPRSAAIESDFLLRYFLWELDYQPSDRAEAVRCVAEKLNPVNRVLSERLLVNGV